MIYSINTCIWSNSHIISNNDFCIIHDDTVKVDEYIIAYRYIMTILAVEIRHNSYIFTYMF